MEKEAKIISFINMKGGVGKTTLCTNLAYVLCKEKNKKILLIDIDPQTNTSQYLLNYEEYRNKYENNQTIFSLYADFVNSQIDFKTVIDDEESTEVEEEINIKKLITEHISGLDIILGDIRMSSLPNASAPEIGNILNGFIKNSELINKYDYIFIDCPPTHSIYTSSALMASNYYLIPVKADFFSKIGISIVKNLIARHNKVNKYNKVKLLGIVFTMLDKTEAEMYNIIMNEHITDVFKEYIKFSKNVPRYICEKKFLTSSKQQSGKLKKIAEEFEKRIEN